MSIQFSSKLLLSFLLGFASVTFLFSQKIIVRVKVDGTSMEPTLHDKDSLMVHKLFDGKYKKNNLITFRASQKLIEKSHDDCPSKNSDYFIKRIVAAYGDEIGYARNSKTKNEYYIIINSQPNPKIKIVSESKPVNFIIPKNEFFVVGDNFNNSCDSRVFGTIKNSQIVGKVGFRYLPGFKEFYSN